MSSLMNLLIRSAWRYLKIITIGPIGKRKAIKRLRQSIEKRYKTGKRAFIYITLLVHCRNKIEVGLKTNGERRTPLSVPPGGSGKLYGIVAVPESCPRSKFHLYKYISRDKFRHSNFAKFRINTILVQMFSRLKNEFCQFNISRPKFFY